MSSGLASFPGLPRLRFLIAWSMQKLSLGEGLGTRLARAKEITSATDSLMCVCVRVRTFS